MQLFFYYILKLESSNIVVLMQMYNKQFTCKKLKDNNTTLKFLLLQVISSFLQSI